MIRPYQVQDEAAVIELWLQCSLVVPQNNPERDIERKLQVNPEWFLVGLADGKVVATCMAGYEGHRGWINYLAVSPQHRRQGTGRRIMEEAEKRLDPPAVPKSTFRCGRPIKKSSSSTRGSDTPRIRWSHGEETRARLRERMCCFL